MQIPAGFAHVAHLFSGDAAPEGAAVTYGLAPNGGSWDPGDPQIVNDLFETHILPQISGAVRLDRTTVKYGPNETGAYHEIASNTNGGAAGEPTPPNVAVLIRKNTAMGGRANRGRLYLPGAREGDMDGGGRLTTGAIGVYQDAVDDWLTAIQAQAMDMVILHTGSQAPTVVTSLACDTRAATQRRRLR